MQDTDVLKEIWEILIEYIPEKDKQLAADHLMPFIVNMELPESEFLIFTNSDHYLQEAANEYLDDDLDSDLNDEW